MSAFDIAATALVQRQENTAALNLLRAESPSIIRIDASTGRAVASPDALMQLMVKAVPGAGAALAEAMLAYAEGGFVSLPSKTRGQPILVPWLAMEDLAYLLGGMPSGIRAALGVDSSRGAEGISDDLHARHSILPPDIFSPQVAPLLSHDPVWLAGRPISPPDPIDPPEGAQNPPPRRRPKSGARGIGHAGNVILGDVAPSTAPDIAQLVDCVIHGQWGPWWSDPVFNSGWSLGFRVCLPYDCADRLSTFLLRFFAPSPLTLGTAFLNGLAQASVTAGIESLCSYFSLWVALATFEVGMNIAFANDGNGKRGVCVYCGWPWLGIPVFVLSR